MMSMVLALAAESSASLAKASTRMSDSPVGGAGAAHIISIINSNSDVVRQNYSGPLDVQPLVDYGATGRETAGQVPESSNRAAALFAIVNIAISSILFCVGRWGYVNAARLSPRAMPIDERRKRVKMLMRGSVVCQIASAALFLAVLISFVRHVIG